MPRRRIRSPRLPLPDSFHVRAAGNGHTFPPLGHIIAAMSDGSVKPHEIELLPGFLQWTPAGRAIVFFLSAMSIWCLLAEFYKLCSMQAFTIYVLVPATALLIAMAILDWRKG